MRNLARHYPSSTLRAPAASSRDPSFLTTPGGWLFVLIAATVILVLITAPRGAPANPALPDQDAYLDYFRYTDWDWVVRYFEEHSSILKLLAGFLSDEIGWRMWILAVNALGFTPENAVRLTVALNNVLIFIALSRMRRPLLGLLLWIVIPAGLSITGLFVIRQGFAFGIAMLIAICWRRPILGMLLASTIHTTLAVPALLLIVARLSGHKNSLSIPTVAMTGATLAASAQILFANFGGRRIGDYMNYQAEFSVNLLVLMLSYALAPVLLLGSLQYIRRIALRPVLRELALVHVGIIVFLLFAFTLFPFGKDRVFYFVSLLLPFFLPEIRIKSVVSFWMTLMLYLMLAAEVFLAYDKGTYAYFFR